MLESPRDVLGILKGLLPKTQDGFARSCAISLGELPATAQLVGTLDKSGVDVLVDSSMLTIGSPEEGKLDVGDAFCSCLVTDRSDGLYTTVVVDEQRVALGVAYSSVKSISEAIRSGNGVYHSRSRGLWIKGLTSGAVQKLLRMDVDKDCLRFMVHQDGPGFCHLNTRTCYGGDSGITALDALLQSRKKNSPPGSYTQRLFNDSKLLESKIMEEAEELCQAQTPNDVAWEAADLIYFALVRCASMGVSLTDVEAHLDRRARKMSRRPGNAKPKWTTTTENAKELPGTNDEAESTSDIVVPAVAVAVKLVSIR
ncbi:PRA-PH-domain-containing protein [Gonapodya prolifera JEL478]|uniref:PRA-PH-domain-containing protein n=1 Tax=Gonapodya prolifera (strain JEL478) TaxID=1344416 RepID=A0A139A1M9_GONPJ|nr:PRA-PH-domain-containing protein [Gonapodya prolifera JEL478]|eukprot:KXS10686.1 PRA-PH-domain-containing protein [Gonapodya prolifera JEL478]